MQESATIEMQEVALRSARGQRLHGVVEWCDTGERRERPVVVLCHGLLGTCEHRLIRAMASALRSVVHVLRYDAASSGRGRSEGSFSYCAYEQDVDDIEHVVQQVEKGALGEAVQVAGVVGHSKGGTEMLLLAERILEPAQGREQRAHFPPPFLLVNVSGRLHMDGPVGDRFTPEQLRSLHESGEMLWRVYGRDWRVTMSEVEERARVPTHRAVSKIVACDAVPHRINLVIVHGDEDEVVPASNALDLHRLVKSAELVVLDGANHSFTTDEHRQALCDHLVRVVSRHVERRAQL